MNAPWRYECLDGVGQTDSARAASETAELALEWLAQHGHAGRNSRAEQGFEGDAT
jgi:GTP cyclohydrolase III